MNILHNIFSHLESAELIYTNLLRLVVAGILGGAIGLERELSHKPAGLRTNMFICFGSAMFTVLSILMVDPSVLDHTRIAANIITGIGFIGAGSILHERGSVQGLTTAATIFVVAGIGMAAGAGFMLLATFATVCILLALRVLGFFETRWNLKPLHMTYEAAGEKADLMVSEINGILEVDHRSMESIQIAPAGTGFLIHFTVCLTHNEHAKLLHLLKSSPVFTRIVYVGAWE